MRLFIAEKPSTAKAIASVLGHAKPNKGFITCGGDVITWAVGHLFELEGIDAYTSDDIQKSKAGNKYWREEDLPVLPENWKSKPKKRTKEQLTIIGKLIKTSDAIVNAGDQDREGNALVDAILVHYKNKKPVSRLWISSTDPVSVKRGLANLKDNASYQGWTNASIARQRADWLVGLNLTRQYTLSAKRGGSNSLITIGRVQTPTLKLVVDRCRAIENFSPVQHYKVHVRVTHPNGSFKAQWQIPEEIIDVDEEGRLLKKSTAQLAASRFMDPFADPRISLYETKHKVEPAPLGLSLADLTVEASRRHKLSAADVLKACQALYDAKLVSYPRTDCRYLPESQHADAAVTLAALKSTLPGMGDVIDKANSKIVSRVFSDKHVTAHHAIVPTMLSTTILSLPIQQQQLYTIIATNYLMQFYPKHEYDQTTVMVESDTDQLKAMGKVINIQGWKLLALTKKEKSDIQVLSSMAVNDSVELHEPMIEDLKTSAPKYFTEGTLIRAMENIYKYLENEHDRKALRDGDGIGTPATRASILAELIRHEYMALQTNYLIATELGYALIDTVAPDLKSPVLTAQFERELLQIQESGGTHDNFVHQQMEFVAQLVNVLKANDLNWPIKNEKPKDGGKDYKHYCAGCDSGLVKRQKRDDPKSTFWGCSNYPQCKMTYPDVKGKPEFATAKKKKAVVTTEHACGQCGESLIRRASKNASKGHWWGCSGFPKCRQTYQDENERPVGL